MDLTSKTLARRALLLALPCVMGAAVAGFFAGTRHPYAPAWTPPGVGASDTAADAPPAVPYPEMDGRGRGPNRDFMSVLARLQPPPGFDPAAAVVNTPEDRQRTLERRAALRAYEGAPPVIPHPVKETDTASCVACHGKGLVVDTVIARPMSHAFMPNCTQCHSPVANPDLAPPFPTDVVFTGLTSPGPGERAWPGAPPVIPHPTRMRENCLACHGTLGWPGIRTTHPERANCLQCHAASSLLDGYDFPVGGELGHPLLPPRP